MKNRHFTVLAGIALLLTMLFNLLPSCGGQTISPAPEIHGFDSAIRWRYQSSSTAGSPTYWLEQEFVASIERASGGRLKLELYPNGAIVGNMEILDAVSTGTIETGSAQDSYWQWKDERFSLIGNGPAQLNWEQAASIYYCDSTGWKQNADLLYEKFNVKRIMRGISEPDVSISNKRIEEASDYRGVLISGYFRGFAEPEFSTSIFAPEPISHFDGPTLVIRDALDTRDMNIDKSAKYWMFPGMQLCRVSSLLINLDKWKQLPDDLQEIVTMACSHNLLRRSGFSIVENAKLITSIQQQQSIEIVHLSPECQQTWKTVSWRIADNYANKDPAFKEMWETQKEFMSLLTPYEELQRVTYSVDK